MNSVVVVSIICVFIAALVIMGVNSSRASSSRTRLLKSELAFGPEGNLKTVFISKMKDKIEGIATCVLKELSSIYNRDETEALINEEQFRNNPQIKSILEKCAFGIVKQIFSVAVKAYEIECNRTNDNMLVDWVVANVPYRKLTDEEIDEYASKVSVYMRDMCWTQESVTRAFASTKNKIKQLIQKYIPEKYSELFYASKKYDDWMNFVSQIFMNKFRENNPRVGPKGYLDILTRIKDDVVDDLTDQGFNKLVSQTEIIKAVDRKWCKDPVALFKAMENVPFEVFSSEEIDKIANKITDNFCWDNNIFKEQTKKVIYEII